MTTRVYFTYQLINLNNQTSFGYLDSVHCNYINYSDINSTANKDISIRFDNPDEFKFLTSDVGSGTGFTATNIRMIVQKIDSTQEPLPDKWKIYDVTDQISGHTPTTDLLDGIKLTSTIFKVNLVDYDNLTSYYDLDYINYPSGDQTLLSFGDEEYFVGNVESDIEARIYAMNMSIPIDLFTYSTNKTWVTGSDTYVTEIGIFDKDYDMVAIGKLNSPIKTGGNNTIIFGLDF